MLLKKLAYNKQLLLLLLMTISSTFFGACDNLNPYTEEDLELGGIFPDADYDRAVAYHFEDLNGRPIIDEEGKLNATVKKEKEMTEEETRDFLQVINNSETYMTSKSCAQCYFPRFGVVFYKGTSVAAHISICLQCGHQKSSIRVGAQGGLENGRCYSGPGLQALSKLCKKMGFGQCG